MKRQGSDRSPRLARTLFRRLESYESDYHSLGDLEEEYRRLTDSCGRRKADRFYWSQALQSLPRYALLKSRWRLAMLKSYVKIAVRSLTKQRAYSLINIGGLAVGIACCLLILLWVNDELRYDTYHRNAHRLYRVSGHGMINNSEINMAFSPGPMAETVVRDFPGVAHAARVLNMYRVQAVRYGEHRFVEDRFFFADAAIFDVMDFEFLEGSAETALLRPNTVVLTESTARKYVGEKEAVGKTITRSDGSDMEITGVIRDLPHRTHLHFDFLGSLSSIPDGRNPVWISNYFYTYVVLKEGCLPGDVEAKFPDLLETYMAPQILQNMGMSMEQFRSNGNRLGYELQRVTDIHLRSRLDHEVEPNGDIAHVVLFSVIALFLLIIACINYMNLATARSAGRSREVGIRKVLGSHRTVLIRQFLVESMFFTAVAVVLAVILVQAALPAFSRLSGKPMDAYSLLHPLFILGLVVLVLFVGLLAGCYPAFYLSSFQPVKVIKGMIKTGPKGRRMRSVLVIFQFSVSVFLIIGTIVISRQLQYIQNRKLGFDKERLLILQGGDALGTRGEAFREALLKNPGIESCSFSNNVPGSMIGGTGFHREGETAQEMVLTSYIWLDHDFVTTYGIEMAAGRFYSREMSADDLNIVVNEETVRRFGYDDPVGERITMAGPTPDLQMTFTIIGVVQDFHFESLHQPIQPLVLALNTSARRVLSVRIGAQNLPGIMEFIETTWKTFVPGMPFQYRFYDVAYKELYESEQRTGRIFSIFSILAILIACLGLFGLASYTAERRTKEIGIRKVLGASVPQVLRLMVQDFLRWVVIANGLAWPLGGIVMRRWLDNFAYRIPLGFGIFAAAAFLALLIAVVTVSFQSVRAAGVNPVRSLRYE